MKSPLVSFARIYLQRKVSPPTVMGLLLKPTSLPGLALLGVLSAAAFVALGLPAAWPIFFVGICIGAAARDLGIAIRTVKYWPIQVQLLHWQKIEVVAAEGGKP